MKKKLLAFLLMMALCLSLSIPCFAATLSDSEVLSRKRAYYPFINESIAKLHEISPQTRNAQIDRIFANANNDYSTPDIIESQRAASSTSSYSISVIFHMTYEGAEYIFINVLTPANDTYELGKFTHSIWADDCSRNVTSLYDTMLDVSSGSDTYLKEKIGEGIFIFNGGTGERYLLDIDLNDYQSCGYSISTPSSKTSAADAPTSQSTPVEPYAKDQELIISGKADFDYFYTYKDTLNYKCFSLTQNGKRFYASVREDLYEYYKNAFKNHSLTLKGIYQFTAEDGSPVVSVSTLVEGTKETNLRSYLWTVNKGSAKNPNLKAFADLKGDGLVLSASKDGQSITIDSNPWGAAKGSQAYKLDNDLALLLIKELNSELGLPDWLYTEMMGTRALDGRQKEVFDYVTVTWSYHPDSGINILYRKNN